MSYILEALRKSERERRLGQVPTLPTLDVEPPKRRPSRLVGLLLLALLLAVNAGVFALFWPKGPAATVPSTAVEDKAAAQADVKPRPSPDALERKVQELESRLAKMDKPPLPVARAVPPSPAPARREVKPPKLPPETASETRESFDLKLRTPYPDTFPVQRPQKMEPSGDDDELPAVIKALKINVLAHSPVPAERFAVIDMARRVPGDRLAGGVVLVDILEDGLIVEWNGERYRIRH